MISRAPDWLKNLLQRPVAVFGAGISGRAAAGLIAELGGTSLIYDRATPGDAIAEFTAADASRHGLVVLSPGFPAAHPWLERARDAGCEVLGELDLGALVWPGRIIAVTGTNGKTTITEFLVHALQSIGRDARAVGNIGEAFSDAWRTPATPNSIAVCEVSSFQAETLRYFTADATLWSNFAEDHLERHPGLEGYFRAKHQLVKRTRSDALFYGPTVREHARHFGIELPAAGYVAFEPEVMDERLAPTIFARHPQRENFLLVRAWWRREGLPDEKLITVALAFRCGAHRLTRVAEIDGVTFWNDSKATNFHAAEAALAGFAAPVLWIGGGRAKGGDLPSFVGRIAPRIRRAFLIGETRETLGGFLREAGVGVELCATLRDATMQAFAAARLGDAVLLSPAFASFDMFRSYDDRGRQFEAIVAELSRTHARASATTLDSPNSPSARSATTGLCPL